MQHAIDGRTRTFSVRSASGLIGSLLMLSAANASAEIDLSFTPENQFTLLQSKMTATIANAEGPISVVTQSLDDQGIVDALKSKAEQGDSVRILVSRESLRDGRASASAADLERAGADVRLVENVGYSLIVSEGMAYGTSMTILGPLSAASLEAGTTNAFLVSEEPESQAVLMAEVVSLWLDSDPFGLDNPTSPLMGIVTSPIGLDFTASPGPIDDTLASSIDDATTMVRLATAGELDRAVIAALLNARARGVTVKVVLGPSATDNRTLRKIARAGIEVRLSESLKDTLLMIDDQTVAVATAQKTGRGLYLVLDDHLEVGKAFRYFQSL